ncbi:MAG: 1,4-dihydroxy-2-naphthoate polyprenyltransferase [Chloroflexi bacterium]|nr:1,4-dihydroxy-2-naphthoate polyprenyltransferase [Chloroflexota bacterium]
MATQDQALAPVQIWLMAARPKTLPAAVAPVIVGSALAFHDGAFAVLPAVAAMVGAVLIQIGVNFANDYFDFVKGVDTPERIGPVRVAASGLITPEELRTGMILVFGLAVLVGGYLVVVGGWPIVAIGVASILAALAYSGGPFPIASHALGDLFVFVFFGLVAVNGTYYVQALTITPTVSLAAAAVGLLNTAILVVNNYRDIDTDAKTNKRTLAVVLGRQGTRVEYVLLIVLAYLILIALALVYDPLVLLALLSVPLAVPHIRTLLTTTDGPVLNRTLAGTAQLTLVYCLLFSVGLVFSQILG